MTTYPDLLSAAIKRMDNEPHTKIADDFAQSLIDLYRAGEQWTDGMVYGAVRDHCVRALNRAHKEVHSIAGVTQTGRARRFTPSTSKPRRDARSGQIVSWQRTLLWNYGLDELEAHLAKLLTDRQELDERTALVRALIASMRRHPDCKKAIDAWQADGHSVDEVDLSG